jgi:hypothetical protein
MEDHQHGMADLFDQLGLPSSNADIQAFIAEHRTLNPQLLLCDAPFWSPMQAKFLREQIKVDADWAVIIDKLDASLR